MLTSIWTHRLIAILTAIVAGFIVDQLTYYPLWGVLVAICFGILGIVKLNNPGVLEKKLEFDTLTASVLRTVILTIFFFAECITAAWIIVK